MLSLECHTVARCTTTVELFVTICVQNYADSRVKVVDKVFNANGDAQFVLAMLLVFVKSVSI